MPILTQATCLMLRRNECRRTVKTARETVDRMKEYEDLYFKRGGALEASRDLHAKMSRVMTFSYGDENRRWNAGGKWEEISCSGMYKLMDR